MSLLHALIAQDSAVLAEHDYDGKNKYSQAVQTILTKLPAGASKLTYSAEDILIHYVKNAAGLVCLVVAEDVAGRRMPFAFLNELQKRFESTFTAEEIEDALPFGMASFNGDIAKLMRQFIENPPRDPIREAQRELDETRNIMTRNIDAVLSRGERIELLVDKTDGLSMQARAFRKRATVVRRKMWWKNIKLTILLGAVMLLLVYALAANFCGISLKHCSS